MKWASSISDSEDLKTAVLATSREIKAHLGNQKPDILFVFVSPQHSKDWHELSSWLYESLSPKHLIGCSGGGIVGNGEEIERRAALSVTAAILPEVEIVPIHFQNDALPTQKLDRKIWERLMGVEFSKNPHFILMPDPFSFDLDILLKGLDFAFPWSKKIGGVSSAATEPGGNILYCDREVLHEGLVGLALSGNIVVDTLVAQGCRPIAEPFLITECHSNQIDSFDDKPPFEVLRKVYDELSAEDQHLFKTSLFVGLAMKEDLKTYQKGDFLIRNIIGINPEGGSLAIAAHPHKGQVLQFHIRDAETSAHDLEILLEEGVEEMGTAKAEGALLFSCMGRGFYLYGKPNHDSSVFNKYMGDIPVGGFFCNGEIGPVHGKTYLHGYTSAFGIFRARY